MGEQYCVFFGISLRSDFVVWTKLRLPSFLSLSNIVSYLTVLYREFIASAYRRLYTMADISRTTFVNACKKGYFQSKCSPKFLSTARIDNMAALVCVMAWHICVVKTEGGARQRHKDVITWKHFPRYWPFVRGIHRSPVNSPHKGQWRGAVMLSLICV